MRGALKNMRTFICRDRERIQKKRNIRHKVWSLRTHGKCLRNCADSDLGKNKGPVLGASRRENQKVNRDHVVGDFKFQGTEFVLI